MKNNIFVLMIIIAVTGTLSSFMSVRFHIPLHLESLFSPMDRGAECTKGEYPVEVNLVFETITLSSALQLLAGFSCNQFKAAEFPEKEINVNYTAVNWVWAVKYLCFKNSLYCRAENGVFYSTPISNLNKYRQLNKPESKSLREILYELKERFVKYEDSLTKELSWTS